jgi:hypothetical protein
MTIAPVTPFSPIQEAWPTLRNMASCLANSFMPVAQRNKSYFVNDIPDELYIDTDPELVSSVLSGLLSAVVRNAKESCIRLSAKIYNNVILVHVQDYNNFNYSPVENGLQQLQSIAEKMGGNVSVTSQRHNVATFAFSFPNLPMAA